MSQLWVDAERNYVLCLWLYSINSMEVYTLNLPLELTQFSASMTKVA